VEVSKVTSKGQTVIPKAVRDALCIEEGDRLIWRVEGERLVAIRALRDPINDLRGMFKGENLVEELLQDRREDLELEEAKWRRLGYEV